MKTAISVPEDVFELSDRLAKKLKVSRSAVFAMGVRKLGQDLDDKDLIARINAVCSESDTAIDPFWKGAQDRALPNEKW